MKDDKLLKLFFLTFLLVGCSNSTTLTNEDKPNNQQTMSHNDNLREGNHMTNHIITAERKEVKILENSFVPFPKDIFVSEQPYLADNFFPLLSIDLGKLNKDFKGTVVHMINPLEPFEQYIGSETQAYYTDFVGENWIAFELTEDNKYKFFGNENYILTASIHQDILNRDSYYAKYIQEMRDSYPERKAYFEKNGKLFSYFENEETSYLDKLGGKAWSGNWTGYPEPPLAFQITEIETEGEDDISITYQGNEFYYIADVAGYNWMAHGADSILMFYEPKSRIVLFTFDWT